MPPAAPAATSIRALAVLLCGLTLAPVACGRTGLDEPVDFTIDAGRGTAGSGAAGSGQAGSLDGFGGSFGGLAGTFGGQAGSFGTGGTAPAVCVDGSRACVGFTRAALCVDGAWESFACPGLCVDDRCTECIPGAATCISNTDLQICDSRGFLQPAMTCPEACQGNACVACIDGDTMCASSEQQETCKGGQWLGLDTCPFTCVGKSCGKNPKIVFVTSVALFGGKIGGIPGADDTCRQLALAANLPGEYFAWLSDSTTSPGDRFTRDSGPYVLVDGSIVANNWVDLTLGTARHAINLTESGGAPPIATGNCGADAVWSDTAPTSSVANPDFSCGDWSDPMAVSAIWGSTLSLDNWSDACSDTSTNPADVCQSAAPLFCFEQ